MNLSRRQFMYLAAGAAALPVVARSAWAQSWPNHVIRLVVGFPPGGGADAAARIAANRLSELWGQQGRRRREHRARYRRARRARRLLDFVQPRVAADHAAVVSRLKLRSDDRLHTDLNARQVPESGRGVEDFVHDVAQGLHQQGQGRPRQGHLCVARDRHHAILPPSCSRIWLVSTSRTCPIAASRRVR